MKLFWPLLGGAALAAGVAAGAFVSAPAEVAAAYVAKTLCSEIFLAGRPEARVRDGEFEAISPALGLVSAMVDAEKRETRASLLGLGAARAVYRDGYGCTLVHGDLAALPPLAAAPPDSARFDSVQSGAEADDRVDRAALEAALDRAMADEAAASRAFVVLVDGALAGERYAEGFAADTPFLGWSMSKSVAASLVGAAALKGALDVEAPAPVLEWAADPARAAITWNDLLRMQSGLAFGEDYADPGSDVSRMLFRARNAGALAAEKPLAHPPGEVWAYSSGTTNIVARALRAVLAERGEDFHAFAREALFAPIGAQSFVMETDSAGDPVASSYVYATARDWARLGQLYLQDGVWNGERLLPEGWAGYVRTPAAGSDGEYGAHFWLNNEGADGARFAPGLPEDMFFMAGHEGQYVFILPDRKAVIVRTGMTRGTPAIDVVAPAAARIAATIRPAGAETAP